ncbi:Ninja family [Quillaja saponaria]|uniref:Ninja-family protein n=1 Tax=Quillaja saponaria TaxID=32244 RepID=A0AAD7KNW7_QUISA|nr:Ninja family [Quillaja saponaria]KAJ7943338.1 Ninja family [Quillaja saponaria]
MGEANEGRSKAIENLAFRIDKHPRDLLQRFMATDNTEQFQYADEDPEEIELNLGLSLGGRFGVDKNPKKLTRSSSIVGTMPVVREDDSTTPPISYPTLIRTSSLPTETEEEWRKRKELQTLRRMEAKRRRYEKQRNSKAEREGGGGSSFEEERREFEGHMRLNFRDKQHHVLANTLGSKVAPPFGLPTWAAAAAARQALGGDGIDGLAKRKVRILGGTGSFPGFGQPCSQGSVDSQGGSSSGMSEMESKPFQGSSSPASNQSLQERSNHEAVGSSGTKTKENAIRTPKVEPENPSKKPDSAENKGREIGMNAVEDMPCVFTKGDGPNGRRIEGILYKYGKGQEVRIMCVCHGSFLSPAEFVKHAGGSDVTHPLKHIVVNPSSTPFC